MLLLRDESGYTQFFDTDDKMAARLARTGKEVLKFDSNYYRFYRWTPDGWKILEFFKPS